MRRARGGLGIGFETAEVADLSAMNLISSEARMYGCPVASYLKVPNCPELMNASNLVRFTPSCLAASFFVRTSGRLDAANLSVTSFSAAINSPTSFDWSSKTTPN